MNQNNNKCNKEDHNADPIQQNISVCSDNKGIVQDNRIEKTCLRSVFL